jgi:hypothetical protein
MATATPKVTRPARGSAGTAKPAPTPASATDTPVVDVAAAEAPKLEEPTVEVAVNTVEPPIVKVVPSSDDMRREGFVLDPAGASKNYARFKVPAGTGCIDSTLYVPLDTIEVKVLLIRKPA